MGGDDEAVLGSFSRNALAKAAVRPPNETARVARHVKQALPNQNPFTAQEKQTSRFEIKAL